MIPDAGSWNRNFMGHTWNANMNYNVKLGNPLPFYHEMHHPVHFLKFANIESNRDELISTGTGVPANIHRKNNTNDNMELDNDNDDNINNNNDANDNILDQAELENFFE